LYGAGSAARQLAAVIMLPIYTRYLSPADYGAVEVCSLIVAAMSLIAGLSLGEGIFRHFHGVHGNSIVSTALWVGIASNGFGAAVIVALAPILAATFLGADYSPTLIMLFGLTLVAECCSAIPMTHMRVEGRSVEFFTLGMLRLALNIAFNVYFVVHRELGPLGVVYGALASTTLVALAALPYTLSRTRLMWSSAAARALVTFGLPLSLANVATFYLNASDRFFIEKYFTLAEVGIYALAARLAQGFLLVFYEPFGQVWDAEKYRLWNRIQSVGPFQSVFRLLCANLLFGAAAISVLAPEILRLLATPAFAGAATIAPYLLAAGVLVSLGLYCRLGSLVSDRTHNVNRAAWAGAVALTVLALALVPWLGAVGAAIAVLGSAAVRLWIDNKLATAAQDFKLPWANFWATSAVVAAFAAAILNFVPSDGLGWAMKIACCIALAAGLWWSPLVRRSERELFMRVVRSW
jgi:O-antigen/teichoic acid export membrane protein